eukprot:2778868-Pyramimonas_sp.AAC.1
MRDAERSMAKQIDGKIQRTMRSLVTRTELDESMLAPAHSLTAKIDETLSQVTNKFITLELLAAQLSNMT